MKASQPCLIVPPYQLHSWRGCVENCCFKESSFYPSNCCVSIIITTAVMDSMEATSLHWLGCVTGAFEWALTLSAVVVSCWSVQILLVIKSSHWDNMTATFLTLWLILSLFFADMTHSLAWIYLLFNAAIVSDIFSWMCCVPSLALVHECSSLANNPDLSESTVLGHSSGGLFWVRPRLGCY